MNALLDPTECRILGVLLEKSLATPEYYPLTVNGLVTGCNQKSNRHPITEVQDWEVEGALQSMRNQGWAEPAGTGGRAVKWRHKVDVRLGLSAKEMAVLTELLLRGPQQPGELRGRASRMSEIATQEALQELLDKLARNDPPLVRRNARVPGERADRWGQTIGREAAPAADSDADVRAPESPPERPAESDAQGGSADRATPFAAPPAGSASTPPARSLLEERVERLERELAELRARIDGMSGDTA